LPKFCMLIKEYKLDEVKTDNKTPFWAVSRVMKKPKPPNENKINVTQYFPSYSKEQSKTNYKEYYSCLVDYLIYFDKSKKTLEAPRKAILNIIIKILDLLNITDENKKRIAKKEFIEHLVEKDNQLYENFKTKLFQWCKCLVSENPNFSLIQDEIIEYLKTNGKDIFGEDCEFDESVNEDLKYFLDPNNSIVDTPNSFIISDDKYTDNANTKLDIKLGTVHSIKGQTHIATLYLDVWSSKKQCHENIVEIFEPQDLFCNSLQLKNCLSEEQKKFAKLLYVAFSRPSHLLCFAVQKSNKNNLPKSFTDLFDLIDA
jgi:DNA helicase II / ATP-dependent DNA helicase PcrA